MSETRWPELGSREDANRTHLWARECLLMWEADRAVLLNAISTAMDSLATGPLKEGLAYAVLADALEQVVSRAAPPATDQTETEDAEG